MKTFFFVAIIASGLFVDHVEGCQQADQASCQLVSHNERQILLQNCHQIRTQVAQYFIYIGAYRSSGCQNAIKQEITNYLQSVRTPEALQLLNEFQANGFRNFI